MKRFISSALFSIALISGTSGVSALSVTPTTSYGGSPIVQQIHLHGIVPVMRYIYVDSQENIMKVVGNTDQNIVPKVVNAATYKDMALSPYINQQYQAILLANGGSLKAGETYRPVAVTVVSAAADNRQSPKLSLTTLKLNTL